MVFAVAPDTTSGEGALKITPVPFVLLMVNAARFALWPDEAFLKTPEPETIWVFADAL